MTAQFLGKSDEDYVEAIAVMAPSGNRQNVERWFEERSFRCEPMQAGFLVSGNRAAIERTFNIRLGNLQQQVELQIPEVLRGDVVSLVIPKLPEYGSQGGSGQTS